MGEPSDAIDMKSCRICLSNKKPLCPLFKYKLSGNYAEMLTAVADVKVSFRFFYCSESGFIIDFSNIH